MASVSTPWRSAAGARPLVAWRSAQLQRVADLLQAVCVAWAEEWGIDLAGTPEATCQPADAVAAGPWQPLAQGDAAWQREAGFARAVALALWSTEACTPVAAAVLHSCRRDLLARLRAAGRWLAPGDAIPPTVAAAPPWSGRVVVILPLGMTLLLDAGAMRQLLGDEAGRRLAPQPAVTSVAAALARSRLGVRVRLEGCEMALGSLKDLRLGDVLRLGHRVGAPALVEAQGCCAFGGFLVRSGGRKAVELAPVHATGKGTP